MRAPRAESLVGLTSGRLTVLERAASLPGNRGARWVCQCECGNKTVARADGLRVGRSRSCGCLSAETAVAVHQKHGRCNSAEYTAWVNMRKRCSDQKSKSWPNYGGRGIKVCPEWDQSFEAFHSHVGDRPGEGFELDRIDNDGDYRPGNVRWVTKAENNKNRRSKARVREDRHVS